MAVTSGNPTCFLRLPQVKQRTGLSRSSIYAKISLGEFPAPVNLGVRAVAWIDVEIAEWISDRVKASRGSLGTDEVSR
jgi:prophage regulatory protein